MQVFCLWFWEAKTNKWVCKEAYRVDGDGHPLLCSDTPPEKWIADEDYPKKSELGRAITTWSAEFGVELYRIVPPSLPPWLNGISFTDRLKKSKWHELLEDGSALLMGTARRAEEILVNDD